MKGQSGAGLEILSAQGEKKTRAAQTQRVEMSAAAVVCSGRRCSRLQRAPPDSSPQAGARKEISFNRSVFLQICTAKTGGREEVCRRVCREDPPGEKNEGHAPQKIERLRGDVNRLRT